MGHTTFSIKHLQFGQLKSTQHLESLTCTFTQVLHCVRHVLGTQDPELSGEMVCQQWLFSFICQLARPDLVISTKQNEGPPGKQRKRGSLLGPEVGAKRAHMLQPWRELLLGDPGIHNTTKNSMCRQAVFLRNPLGT